MKPVYSNIQPITGPLVTGICTLKILPREWLASPLAIDFSSNTILTEPALVDGRAWIDLQLVEPTYEYNEKPKTSKGGSYYEISLTGTINNITYDSLQTLETLRYHEFIALVKDRQGRSKIVGDIDTGMQMQISHKETNDRGGNQTIAIELFMLSGAATPFYID